MIDPSQAKTSARRSLSDHAPRGAADVSVPDVVVLPEQFFGGATELGLPDSPEKRLVFAVLLDAVAQLRQPYSTRALEVERWIRDVENERVFSFSNVCTVLGFDPGFLSRALLAPNPHRARARIRHIRTSRLRVTPRRHGRRTAATAAA